MGRAGRPRDPGHRFSNRIRSATGSATLAQRAWFVGRGACAGFVSKAPTARHIDIGFTMNITGMDFLMTALAEERGLHIARRLIVARTEPRISSNEYILGNVGGKRHGWLIRGGKMTANNILKQFSFLGLIIFIIAGCSATGPSYQSLKSTISQLETGQARLYFIRDSSLMGSGLSARIIVNEKVMPGLGMGGFIYTDEKIGNIYIKVDGGSFQPGEAKLTLDAKIGKIYYFSVEPNRSNIAAGAFFGVLGSAAQGGGPFVFNRISEQVAQEKLKTKKLSN